MSNPGIYFHVPFCHQKCLYCAFYSVTEKAAFWPSYCRGALRDIALLEEFAWEAKHPDTLYLGGGTPSLLSPEDWEKLLSPLLERHPWEETTIEMNPGSSDEEKILGYKNLGINRVSLGIQSLDPEVLRFLGRIHTEKQALVSLDMLSRSFENFSVDLILAIPGFPFSSLQNTATKLVEQYHPKHISAYSLTIEPGTPLSRLGLETKEEQFVEEYLWLHEYLVSKGYKHYEVSNFALPGYEAKHNTKYWKRIPYLGIGPAAHSLWNERRFAYEDFSDFERSDLLHHYEEAERLTPEEIREEEIMLGLRTRSGIPLSLLTLSETRLQKLEEAHYIERKSGLLFPTLSGWMVLNSLIVELI